jgi:hypothetical protein
MVVGTTFSRRPPMMAGVAKALAASANTIRPPDSTPGITCGSTMRASTVQPGAQRFGRLLGRRVELLQAGPHRQHHERHQHVDQGHHHAGEGEHHPDGLARSGPAPSALVLITPSLPSSTAQPSVRTTTLISSGPSTMTIDTARQLGDRRLST